MTLEIEKGVPLPNLSYGKGRPIGQTRAILEKMEVNDSVLFPFGYHSSAVAKATTIAKENGWKFTSKKMPDGLRVWRIA